MQTPAVCISTAKARRDLKSDMDFWPFPLKFAPAFVK